MMDKTLTTVPPLAWAVQISQGKPKPAVTVEPTLRTDSARQNGHAPQDGSQVTSLAAEPAELPDPDGPTGPPPAFKANVLEAERARLRRPEPLSPDRTPLRQAAYEMAGMPTTGASLDLAL